MTSILHCDQFDELLPDLLEETLAPEARQVAEAHLRSCVRCAGLVADLTEIRGEAAALPTMSPSRDLWSDIAMRIEAPVVTIGSRPPATVAGRRIHRAWLAAAAVTLMTLSSGTTYWMTRMTPTSRSLAPSVPPEVVAEASVPFDSASPATLLPARTADESASRAGSSTRGLRVASRRTSGANPSAEATYEKEVVALRRILAERSPELDPKTVAILDASLKMIDHAIQQSRQALSADPASGFLRDQLNKALDRKVEVLRTAAMLPART